MDLHRQTTLPQAEKAAIVQPIPKDTTERVVALDIKTMLNAGMAAAQPTANLKYPIDEVSHKDFLKRVESFLVQIRKYIVAVTANANHISGIREGKINGALDEGLMDATIALDNATADIVRNDCVLGYDIRDKLIDRMRRLNDLPTIPGQPCNQGIISIEVEYWQDYFNAVGALLYEGKIKRDDDSSALSLSNEYFLMRMISIPESDPMWKDMMDEMMDRYLENVENREMIIEERKMKSIPNINTDKKLGILRDFIFGGQFVIKTWRDEESIAAKEIAGIMVFIDSLLEDEEIIFPLAQRILKFLEKMLYGLNMLGVEWPEGLFE